jgi:sialate O-acetylesterase
MKACWIFFVLCLATASHAELQLNGLFTDHMVLQRNQEVPVWGTADPGEEVRVEFAGQQKKAVAGARGEWQVLLDPMKASSSGQSLQVSSFKFHFSLSNVLIGDVWLCGGQSNMATLMKQYPLIWDPIQSGFNNDQVRMFKIKQGGVGAPEPTKALVIDPFFKDSWQACTPEFAAEFSATAGFFGLKLQRDTGVPVGLLYAVRGGTQANMWMPRAVLEAHPDYARFLDDSNNNWKSSKNNPDAIRAPSRLYNGTIHPLVPFAIRGVIWYQGESDSQWSELYESLMGDLIASWRAAWGYEFPFLYVQLAPYNGVNWDQIGEGWAWLRDAQYQTLKSVPKTGMVVITDGGEAKDIHPQAKKLPGERLATLAASLDDPKVNADFPTLEKMKIKDGRALLKFNQVASGLATGRVALNSNRGFSPGADPEAVVAAGNELKGFTICGADRKFVPAVAEIISKDVVEVSSPAVKDPIAVRYGWANFPLCNLYGGNGMPAVPFRTDDFPMPNLTAEKLGQAFEGVRSEWGASMNLVDVDDGTYERIEIDGVQGLKAKGSYLYFLSPEPGPRATRLTVLYYDEGFATVQLRYDSASEEIFAGDRPGAWKPAGEVRCRNSKQWKFVSFDLPDARFKGGCNGADIRIQSTGAMRVGGVYCFPIK